MDDDAFRKVAQGLRWEALYRGLAVPGSEKRWSLGECSGLDPDLDQALRLWSIQPCRTLDLGAGTGSQAVALAERGYAVTALDVSETALNAARKKAEAEHVAIRCVCENVLVTALDERFDLAIDRGCFTILPHRFRPAYARVLDRLLVPGGWYLLKTDGKNGEDVMKRSFGDTFTIVATRASVYNRDEGKPLPAWLSVLRKPVPSWSDA